MAYFSGARLRGQHFLLYVSCRKKGCTNHDSFELKYSETCPKDHLRNRDNLGIKDTYFSLYIYLVHRNEPEK